MTITFTPARAPLVVPRAPGFARAFGRATVFGYQRGVTVPLPGVTITAYAPGTDTPWPDPLYLDESGTVPATFPVSTDTSGAVALWADSEGRLELACTASGYNAQRVVLDLEFPPAYVDPAAVVTSVNGAAGDVVLTAADVGALPDDYVPPPPVIPPEYLTESEGDLRYLPAGYVPPPADVTVTGDTGVGVTESPANTFALATKVSPDAANALALRANGLYATDTTGVTSGYWQAGAGTTPKLTVQSTAPSSPATGDLWVW